MKTPHTKHANIQLDYSRDSLVVILILAYRGVLMFIGITPGGLHFLGLRPTPTQQSKALSSLFQFVPVCSSLFQFVAVCSSLSYLHLVSKIDEIPWGQIWVTVFRVVRGNSAGHGGSRQTASSNQWHMDVKVVLLLTPQGFSQLRVEARPAGALVSMSFHEGKSRESVGAPLVPLGFRAAMRAQGTQRKQLSNRRNCLLLHAAAISVFCLCSAFKES